MDDNKSACKTQVGGTHYEDMVVQPIYLIETYKLTYQEGNVLKYVMRYKSKNGKEDLEKALDYLRMLEEGRNSLNVCWYDIIFRYLPITRYAIDTSLPYEIKHILASLLYGRLDRRTYRHLKESINNMILELQKKD
jgi:hypothetical protein